MACKVKVLDTIIPGSANKFPVVDAKYVSLNEDETQYLDTYLENLNKNFTENITNLNTAITTLSAVVDKLAQRVTALENGTVATLDKTTINSLISQADGLEEDEYTISSWESLDVAYKAAENARDNATTQGELDEAAAALEQAINNLIKRITFKIGNISYTADPDMTWFAWANNESYNTSQNPKITCDSNMDSVYCGELRILSGTSYVLGSQKISSNGIYTIETQSTEIEFVIDASDYDQGENREYSVAAGTTWQAWYDTDAPDSYNIDSDNRIIPAGGWHLEDSLGNTIYYANSAIAAGTYYWKADNAQEDPTGIVDTIIANEMPMYQVNESGELVEVSYKLLNFDTTTAAVAATESGFYQIKDTAGNVIESGYQHASNPNDSMYYVIVLPKEMDFNTNVSVQSWDALQNEWSSDRVVMSNDLAMIERAFTDAGLTLPEYDTEKYTLWLDASLDTCSGIDYRFIINE